jgi:hypothetical protein
VVELDEKDGKGEALSERREGRRFVWFEQFGLYRSLWLCVYVGPLFFVID